MDDKDQVEDEQKDADRVVCASELTHQESFHSGWDHQEVNRAIQEVVQETDAQNSEESNGKAGASVDRAVVS